MQNSPEIGRCFYKFVPENPAKFDFFFRDLHVSEALSQLNPSILTGQTLLALALCLIA